MFFVLKFEVILIIGSNNVLTEGARKVYHGRQGARARPVGEGCSSLTSMGYRIPLAYKYKSYEYLQMAGYAASRYLGLFHLDLVTPAVLLVFFDLIILNILCRTMLLQFVIT
jgi:hypothetical protein